MLNAYIIKPKDLHLDVSNSGTSFPLSFSACQLNRHTGKPKGFVAINGVAYVKSPTNLPVFAKYDTGDVDIIKSANTHSVAYSQFAITGAHMLLKDGQTSGYFRLKQECKKVKRIALGTLDNGNVIVVYGEFTAEEISKTMYVYGVKDAMLIASDDVYFNAPSCGIATGTRPYAILVAEDFEEVPTPIILIDAAHGGEETGNTNDSLQEKSINLKGALWLQSYLKENYQGTFILTRERDTYMPIEERNFMATAACPDLLVTLHVNVNPSDSKKNGYRSYGKNINKKRILLDIHRYIQNSLIPKGLRINDMCEKYDPLFEGLDCPCLGVEMLYLDNEYDIPYLKSEEFMEGVYEEVAVSIASVLGLNRRTATKTNYYNKAITYRVEVGHFNYRSGANEMVKKLQELGFSPRIIEE